MSTFSFADLELVLAEFDIGSITYDDWAHDSEGIVLTRLLRDCEESKLRSMTGWLSADQPTSYGSVETGPPVVGVMRIFLSHSAKEAVGAEAIADSFREYGIEVFVAHKSIQADAYWRREIGSELDLADAGVALLSPDFKTSDWCSQEVGWLQGRHIPVVTLGYYGIAPYGPLAERQGIIADQLSSDTIADKVVEVLHSRVGLQSSLASSYVVGMRESRSFAITDRIWFRLRELRNLTNDQCSIFGVALDRNTQVFWPSSPHDGKRAYTEVIPEFLKKQPHYKAGLADE